MRLDPVSGWWKLPPMVNQRTPWESAIQPSATSSWVCLCWVLLGAYCLSPEQMGLRGELTQEAWITGLSPVPQSLCLMPKNKCYLMMSSKTGRKMPLPTTEAYPGLSMSRKARNVWCKSGMKMNKFLLFCLHSLWKLNCLLKLGPCPWWAQKYLSLVFPVLQARLLRCKQVSFLQDL